MDARIAKNSDHIKLLIIPTNFFPTRLSLPPRCPDVGDPFTLFFLVLPCSNCEEAASTEGVWDRVFRP